MWNAICAASQLPDMLPVPLLTDHCRIQSNRYVVALFFCQAVEALNVELPHPDRPELRRCRRAQLFDRPHPRRLPRAAWPNPEQAAVSHSVYLVRFSDALHVCWQQGCSETAQRDKGRASQTSQQHACNRPWRLFAELTIS